MSSIGNTDGVVTASAANTAPVSASKKTNSCSVVTKVALAVLFSSLIAGGVTLGLGLDPTIFGSVFGGLAGASLITVALNSCLTRRAAAKTIASTAKHTASKVVDQGVNAASFAILSKTRLQTEAAKAAGVPDELVVFPEHPDVVYVKEAATAESEVKAVSVQVTESNKEAIFNDLRDNDIPPPEFKVIGCDYNEEKREFTRINDKGTYRITRTYNGVKWDYVKVSISSKS